MKLIYSLIFIGILLIEIKAKWVRDADSKIIDEIQQNPSVAFLIQFHAPWFVEIQ